MYYGFTWELFPLLYHFLYKVFSVYNNLKNVWYLNQTWKSEISSEISGYNAILSFAFVIYGGYVMDTLHTLYTLQTLRYAVNPWTKLFVEPNE